MYPGPNEASVSSEAPLLHLGRKDMLSKATLGVGVMLHAGVFTFQEGRIRGDISILSPL